MKFDLVFEGGGAKGLAHVGAIKEFVREGNELGRMVGTSAGAMSAGLLAAGFSPDELKEAALEKLPNGKPVFSGFMDIPTTFSDQSIEKSRLVEMMNDVGPSWVPQAARKRIEMSIMNRLLKSKYFREAFAFVEFGGIYSGDTLYQWLHDKLETKGFGKATFKEFHEKTGNSLTVMISDTTAHQMLAVNHITAPDCPVAWGIRMSMNLPFVWEEIYWKKEWGKYEGQDITGHAMVDGGLISNFPLQMFEGKSPEVLKAMGTPTGHPVLGLVLDEKLEVPGAPPVPEKKEKNKLIAHSRILARIGKITDTIMGAHDAFVESAFKSRVCHLPVKGYGTTEFDMSNERIEALIHGGEEAMKAYLKTRKDVQQPQA